MSKLREAAQQALEVLDSKHDFNSAEWRVMHYQAFQDLRAALSEESLQRLTDVQQQMEFVHVAYRFQHPCGGWDYGEEIPAGFDADKWASQKLFAKVAT